MSLVTILDNPVKLTRLACLAVVRAGCPGPVGGAQARAPTPPPGPLSGKTLIPGKISRGRGARGGAPGIYR